MDKFDDFLKTKAETETKDFILPKSFDDKIENILDNLESDKSKKKWNINKKVVGMVACFAFVCLIGLTRFLPQENSRMKSSGVPQIASMKDDAIENSTGPELYAQRSYGSDLIDINTVSNLSIKVVESSKYKAIDKQDDINNIINFINSIDKKEVESTNIDKWAFLIQTSGSVNHSIFIKNNILSIDDKYYEINTQTLSEFEVLYKGLDYQENNYGYCDYNE